MDDSRMKLPELNPKDYGLADGARCGWKAAAVDRLEVDMPKRSVVAFVSTTTVDDEGEVILPDGVDMSRFKKAGTVFYAHDYMQPCGVCDRIVKTADGLVARTVFPERPIGYEGRWLPDEVWAMFSSEPPMVRGFSIGFAYGEVRPPTEKDRKRFGDSVRAVISKSRLLEYSVAPLPMNEDSLAYALAKSIGPARVWVVNESYSVEAETVEAKSADPDAGIGEAESSDAVGVPVAVVEVPDMENQKTEAGVEVKATEPKTPSLDDIVSKTVAATVAALEASRKSEREAANRKVIGDGEAKAIRIESIRRVKPKHLADADIALKAGAFFGAALWGKKSCYDLCDQLGIKVMNEGVNSAGGFVVPEEVESSIIDLREQYGTARQVCKVMPMGSDVLRVNRRSGGLTAYAVTEAGSITASDKSWDAVNLVAKKWATLTRYSSELAEDALISIGDDLAGEIAYAFANKEDDIFWNGDGTSTYHGCVGLKNGIGSAAVADADSGDSTWATLDLDDFHRAVGLLPQWAFARGQVTWLCSRQFFEQAMNRLAYAGGGNTTDLIRGGAGAVQFLGYPVRFIQTAPTATAVSTISAVIGAFNLGCTLGDRRGVTVATSTDRYFDTDEVAIRGTTRFDIVCHDIGDSSTVGAVAAVKTAAS